MRPTAPRPRFSSTGPFHTALKQRVEAYFEQTGASRLGGPAMALKTFVMFAWLVGSYLLALLGGVEGWQAALLACSMGLAGAGIGFNVMHDANHGSYARDSRLNRLLGFSADLVGVSSYVWRQKHNVLHHTYTNLSDFDDDLDAGGLLRLAPWQARHPLHRFQHLYVWFLYALFPLRWWLIDDFRDVVRGRIGTQNIPRPSGWALAELLAGKVLFVGWAFVVPALLHPTWWLLPLWGLGIATLGVVLAVVFQLAHCVEEAEFFDLQQQDLPTSTDWAAHQVRTTVDFAQNNRLVSWYVGGLNFQIEHHLFPRISHRHYPALARIVAQTCRDHGLTYRATPTFREALVSNIRWLRRMGQSEARREARASAPGRVVPARVTRAAAVATHALRTDSAASPRADAQA